MKRFFIVLLAFVLAGSAAVYSDATPPKSHMSWNITGLVNGVESNVSCVGEPFTIRVINKNIKRPLDHVLIMVYYLNDYVNDKVGSLMTTYTGDIQFFPNASGTYELKMSRQDYFTEATYVKAVACSTPETTTLPATTTTEEPTTTEPPTTTSSTTTSSTTTTTIEATCSDGVQNQGEEGIDCGGPCKSCPSAGNFYPIVMGVSIVILVLAIVLFAMRRNKKAKPELVSKDDHPKHRKKHKEK